MTSLYYDFKNQILTGKLHSYRSSPIHLKNIEQKVQRRYESDVFQAGMNILVYGHPNMSEVRPLFKHLLDLGINSIAITFPFYQADWQANQVSTSPIATPTLTELQKLIEEAHAIGLRVMLRPILDEKSLVTTGMWRGQINPTDPDSWFDSYRNLLLTYAELAQDTNIKLLNIGTELNSLQNHYKDKWLELIKDIRAVYKGELIYSFNWDSVRDILLNEFTELLDYVGIDAYFPLERPDGASVEELKEEWEKWINELKDLFTHESIIITEAGVVPVTGAYRTPYSWHIPYAPLDWEAQSNYYEATYQVWRPMIQGIYWWNVTLNHNREEVNYSPLHSPTESVIKRHFLGELNNESID